MLVASWTLQNLWTFILFWVSWIALKGLLLVQDKALMTCKFAISGLAFVDLLLLESMKLYFVFQIAGYVQKITARTDIEVMEDLDNGKPPWAE